MIYSFTGQPHAGKTTLAKHLKNVLEFNNPEKKVFIIDGDDLRKILKNKDYSDAGRRDNISKAYAIARFLHKDEENDVILAVVSPFRDLREDLKLDNNVVEVYVHTTDIRGRENFHVGNYEEPLIDFLSIDTSGVDEMTSMNELLEKIQQKHKENGN
jgi:adenylylsulfate kinase-like enzyme